jgi:hypothetical protein
MLRNQCQPTTFHSITTEDADVASKNGRCDEPLMPRSHQISYPVLAVKLLGIMLRNRCWPTTFHTITTEDADDVAKSNRCDEPLRARSNQTSRPILVVQLVGIMLRNRCQPTTFHTTTTEDADDVARNNRCDEPLRPRSHQTSHPVPAVKSLEIISRNKCWPTTFHTITVEDADDHAKNGRCDEPLTLTLVSPSQWMSLPTY